MAEARLRDATVLTFTDQPDPAAAPEHTVAVEAVPDWLSPLVAILPAQQLAVAMALARGVDVDRPFGLSKVTKTT